MDWLSKVEEERRQKTAAEQEANEKRRGAAEEASASLTAIEARLRPTLDPLVDDIERRLGLRLGVRLTGTELSVSAPKPPTSNLVNEHRIVFSDPRGGARLRIEAVRADQIHRSSEYKPDDMTLAEWRGEDQVIVNGEVKVEDLLTGDLQLLIEWLVRTALNEREKAPAPKIRTIPSRQQKAPSGCAFVSLALLIVGGGVVVSRLVPRQQEARVREFEAPTPAFQPAAASPGPTAGSPINARPEPAQDFLLRPITDPEIAAHLTRQIRRTSFDRDPIVVVSLEGERAWINLQGTNVDLHLAVLEGVPGNEDVGNRFSRKFTKDDASLLVQYEVVSSFVNQEMGCERTEYRLSLEVSDGEIEEHIEPESYGEGC